MERTWPVSAPAWEAGGGCSPPLSTPPGRGRARRGGGGTARCPAGARPVCTARAGLRSGWDCAPRRRALVGVSQRGERSGALGAGGECGRAAPRAARTPGQGHRLRFGGTRVWTSGSPSCPRPHVPGPASPCALGGAPQRGWTDPPGLAASRPRPGFPTSLAWPRTCCSANARAPGGSAGPCGPTALSPARCRLQRLASFAGHFAKCRLNARSCVPARERGPPGRTAGSGGSWPGISGARGRRRAHSLSCLVPKPGRRLLRAAPGSAGPQSLGRRQRQRGGRGGVFRAGPGSPRCWAPTG